MMESKPGTSNQNDSKETNNQSLCPVQNSDGDQSARCPKLHYLKYIRELTPFLNESRRNQLKRAYENDTTTLEMQSQRPKLNNNKDKPEFATPLAKEWLQGQEILKRMQESVKVDVEDCLRGQVEVTLPCGHFTKCLRYQSKEEAFLMENCPGICNTELKCGHKCRGTCGQCFQGRLHVVCEMKCQKILVCGHPCKSGCSNSCPPCSRPCENRCPHRKCPQLCGYPCSPCLEQCSWKCEHFKCNQLCSEPCDRPPCDHPCDQLLICSHPCVGLCGEPCPKLCRICNKEELQAVFFGNEDEPDARFLQLEDCHHVLEIQGLTEWVQEQIGGAIKAISCPKCKTPIRRNLRFGKDVNKSLSLIELVKEKSFGKLEEKRELQRQVRLELLKIEKYYPLWRHKVKKIYEVMKNELSDQQIQPPRNVLIAIQNNTAILKELLKILYYHRVNHRYETRSTLEKYIHRSANKIICKMAEVNHNSQTVQLFDDISMETRRLQWMVKVAIEFKKSTITTERAKEFIAKLTSCKAMTEADFDLFNSWKEELKIFKGGVYLEISMEETMKVVRVMGLPQGNWYCCPNGHVYCVSGCGRPMEEGTCNECKSTIGGCDIRSIYNRPFNFDNDFFTGLPWM